MAGEDAIVHVSSSEDGGAEPLAADAMTVDSPTSPVDPNFVAVETDCLPPRAVEPPGFPRIERGACLLLLDSEGYRCRRAAVLNISSDLRACRIFGGESAGSVIARLRSEYEQRGWIRTSLLWRGTRKFPPRGRRGLA